MVKVVKIYLISEQVDEQGKDVDYNTICGVLWDLQRETREIKNKTVQLCWEWSGFSSDYYKKYGEYPKEKNLLDYTMGGFVYDPGGTALYLCMISALPRPYSNNAQYLSQRSYPPQLLQGY